MGRTKRPLPAEKECKDCLLIKPIAEFYDRSRGGDKCSYCKACFYERTRKSKQVRYENQPTLREFDNAMQKQWRINNPEKWRDISRQNQAMARQRLPDYLVRQLFKFKTAVELPQDLIEAKREQIKLFRYIKEQAL